MRDPSINACLAVKKSRAATYGIHFEVISELMRELPLESADACSLIGNMLDNAIEACAKVDDEEKRNICLRIVDHRDNIMVSVENTAKNVQSITMGQTDKSAGHGLGIKQMNNIVKKAGGFLEIKVTPEKDKVIVSAVLPID